MYCTAGATSGVAAGAKCSMLENYLAKSIDWKEIFTQKFRKPGGTCRALSTFCSVISLRRQMYCVSKFQYHISTHST